MMNMKKIGYILIVLILILILIILQIYKYKENNSDDIMIFGLWNDIGDKNEYVINPQNHTTVQIDVFKTINNATKVYKKIAPGSFGSFVIKLTRPIQSNYEITLSFENAVCPHCKNVTKHLDVAIDDLVFQTYQRLMSSELDLSHVQDF